MTRTLYDSTNVADIPKDADMVGAYVDGRYANVAAARERFPHARLVTITVLGTAGANVCDTEPGNIGPEGAARWAKAELDAGREPSIYCMASQWGAVKAACREVGVKVGDVSWWIADYDNDPAIPRGAVAKQYADPATHGKGHFDLSSVRAFWPGVDPKPEHDKDHGGHHHRPAKPEPKARPTVRRGSKGSAVRHAQVRLTVHGARLQADGDFGPVTEAAVRHFQRRRHLAVDGIVGPQTWKALDS